MNNALGSRRRGKLHTLRQMMFGLCFDVSPFHLRDLCFWGRFGSLSCGFLFGLGVVFCCLVACLVCFPHRRDLLFLLNCESCHGAHGMGEKKMMFGLCI